ncbi:MAG: dehydrogenase [Verrucomicrobia bacterium]|nr:dehydrogenase [Verrucomicrobiota bacterium]
MTDADRTSPLALYRTMLVIRRVEERLARSHRLGLIHGACHTCVGQEAIAAAVCAHLGPDDPIFSTHRGHGHALAKGVDPGAMVAELYGRETGCSRGRGGSMHLFAPEVGLMGTSGIVGPCILQAAGAGYSSLVLGDQRVSVAFFGDGAVNNGAFHEGLNMASIWRLPVLFVCENNQFATEVPFASVTGNPGVAERGAAYGLPSVSLDGNDALAVEAAVREAVARARSGGGPTLLECRTYRTRAHAEGMGDFTYRTRAEVDAWKERCPIARLRAVLLDRRLADETGLVALEHEVEALAEAAHASAEAAAAPAPEGATTHVVAGPRPGPPREAPGTGPGTRELPFARATLEALSTSMSQDPRIFVLGEGIGARGGNFATTNGLFAAHGPVRLRDTPICERGFVGLACGAAMTGTRPVVDFMFADFVLDAAGEIINQIAKMRYMSSGRLGMPVVLRGCIGIGHSAATHHSGSYYSMYAHFPGLKVVVPSTPRDAKGLLRTALTGDDPVLFLEHRELMGLKGPVPEEDYSIDFGKASVVRPGRDITVVALALMVHRTLEACRVLEAEGISVELIDPRTVAPLDVGTILDSVARTGRLLIVDEDFAHCGIGAEIAARLAEHGFDDLDAPIRRLNGSPSPTPYSPSLEAAVVPDVRGIASAIRDLCAE